TAREAGGCPHIVMAGPAIHVSVAGGRGRGGWPAERRAWPGGDPGVGMNWGIPLAGIRMSRVARAVLLFRGFGDQNPLFPVTLLALGGFLLAALLVLTTGRGIGYNGQFTTDAFSSFVKILILAGAALALILSLDYNRKNHIARFEYPVLMVLAVVGMM